MQHIGFHLPNNYKIFLVEDDDNSARIIRAGMRDFNCHFEHCRTAHEALEHPHLKKFDIIILDVGLPGDMDGIECCAKLRRIGFQGGILFLTKRGDETTRVLSFSSGGDAFLAKPFSFEEFIAIIQALIKKLETKKKNKKREKLQAGEITLDQNLYKLDIGKGSYYLPAKEFLILELLMKNKEKMVPREQILQEVWGNSEEEIRSNSVDVHMGRLRKKVGKDRIKTIRGRGYCFTMK